MLNRGKSNEKFVLPEEVSAKILKSLKDQAEVSISYHTLQCREFIDIFIQ